MFLILIDTTNVERYELTLNYKDPFLGNLTKRNEQNLNIVQSRQKSKVEANKKVVEVVQIDWSFIDYVGQVYNK